MSAYGSPFAGLNISVGGSLSRTVFEYTKLIKDKGGNVSNVVTEKTTHYVTTEEEAQSSNIKIRNAVKYGAYIVNEAWLQDFLKAGFKPAESNYFIGSNQPSAVKSIPLAASSEATPFAAPPAPSTTPTEFLLPPNFPIPPALKKAVKGVKAHAYGAGAPSFPADWEISRRDVLQFTDLKMNNNKYYGMELHVGKEGGKQRFRIFTHYGRTDDLERDPTSGAKEVRHFPKLDEAQACYQLIYNEKTGPSKGYRPVHLHSSNIGSEKARGAVAQSDEAPPAVHAPSSLDPDVQALVEYIYSEATSALTSSISAKITSRGIDTPLGILTLKQIEKGEAVLMQLYQAIMQGSQWSVFEQLSGEFYTIIPHRIGKSKQDTKASVISTLKQFEEKQELLQLMKDMIQVNESGQVLFSSGVDMKYKALHANLRALKGYEFEERKQWVLDQQVKSHNIDIVNIFTVQREVEHKSFHSPGNERLLFHGSRISNWVGLLSRGLLMPKVVVSMGGGRTDVGMLGNGIYFGSAACTSAGYTTAGQKGTRFMLVCNVGLGNIKDYTQITKGLSEPPHPYHSVHGVRRTPFQQTDFEDDEYVIFNTRQQRQEYLVEFVLSAEERSKIQHWTPSSTAAPAVPVHAHHAHHTHPHVHAPAPAFTPAPASTFSFSSAPAPAPAPFSFPAKSVAMPHHTHHAAPHAHVVPTKGKPAVKSFGAAATVTGGDSGGDPANYMTAEQRSIKEAEDNYRRLFATDRNNSSISAPFVHLKDVFALRNEFNTQNPAPNEGPFLFSNVPRASVAIATKDQFKANWETFTSGQLRGMNWDGVFAAGGSVLCCLTSNPLFNVNNNKSSDVDLFLYGMSEDQATAKLQHIYSVVQQNTGSRCEIVRAKHAVTILGQFPNRHIQIVLRIYRSPAEVLMGFDIDCCCVGYSGETAYALPRAQRAITKGYNLVDLSRRSLTYEVRLFKYAKRGYHVALPGHDPGRVDPNVFNGTLKDAKGLAKLLLLERLHNQGSGPAFAAGKKAFRPRARRSKKKPDEYNEDARYEADAAKADASDYNLDVFIPWGPNWLPFNILKQLDGRDKANYYIQMKKAPGTQQHNHIFVSGLQGVLTGVSSTCQLCKISPVAQYGNDNDGFVRGPLRWLTDNPGRQLLTGSFHPVDDQNWDAGVYIGGPAANKAPAPASSGFGGFGAPASSFGGPSTGFGASSSFGGAASSGFGAASTTQAFGGPTSTISSFGASTAPKKGGPKRPMSAFLLYSTDAREQLKAQNPGLSFGELGKKLAETWVSLSDYEKAKYQQKAEESRREYEAAVGLVPKKFGGGDSEDESGSGSDEEKPEKPAKPMFGKAKAKTTKKADSEEEASEGSSEDEDDEEEDEDESPKKSKAKAKSPMKKSPVKTAKAPSFGAKTSSFGAKTSFGATPVAFGATSSFGATQPASGGFGSQPASGGSSFGAQPASAAFGSGGFSTQPASSGFGAQPVSGGFVSQPASSGFGTQPASSGFGAQPGGGSFGSPSGGFGAQPTASFGASSPAKTTSFSASSPVPATAMKRGNSTVQQQLAAALTAQFGGASVATPESDDLSRFGGGTATNVFIGETPAPAAAPPGASAFGGGTSKLAVFGDTAASPAPAPTVSSFSSSSFSAQQLPSSFAAPAADSQTGLKEAFKSVEPPKSPVAKLLLLISMLHKGGRISDVQKDQIKDLVINGDKSVICALEVFEVERDFDELTDTLQRILKLSGK